MKIRNGYIHLAYLFLYQNYVKIVSQENAAIHLHTCFVQYTIALMHIFYKTVLMGYRTDDAGEQIPSGNPRTPTRGYPTLRRSGGLRPQSIAG